MYNFLILLLFPNKKKYYRVSLDTCTCPVKIPLSFAKFHKTKE